MNRLPFYFTPWVYLHNNAPAAWKVLEIFGANYAGLGGIWLALAFVHMASVFVVAWALVRVARRFFGFGLVDQVLRKIPIPQIGQPGETESPYKKEGVLQANTAQFDAARQRRSWWPRRRKVKAPK